MATHLFLESSRKYKWNVGIVHGTMGNEKFEFLREILKPSHCMSMGIEI